MKAEIIFIILLLFFIVGVVLGDMQTQIKAIRVDNKNLKQIIVEHKAKEANDTDYLREKWYELDRKISY